METTKKTTTILTFILLAVIIFTLWFFAQNKQSKLEQPQANVPQITTIEVQGELFTGSYPVLQGEGNLVELVNDYVTKTVAEFKESADKDVPGIIEEFGADVPSAKYSLSITAEYFESMTTKSVVLGIYHYTGGANGNSSYETFTVDTFGQQVYLSDIIREDQQVSFVEKLKNTILDWRVEGQEEPLVFAEDVEKVTFDSLDKFALTSDALIIYFNKYDVAPGYVGAPSFALPLSEVGQYFTQSI